MNRYSFQSGPEVACPPPVRGAGLRQGTQALGHEAEFGHGQLGSSNNNCVSYIASAWLRGWGPALLRCHHGLRPAPPFPACVPEVAHEPGAPQV